jgi:hypothetical protein
MLGWPDAAGAKLPVGVPFAQLSESAMAGGCVGAGVAVAAAMDPGAEAGALAPADALGSTMEAGADAPLLGSTIDAGALGSAMDSGAVVVATDGAATEGGATVVVGATGVGDAADAHDAIRNTMASRPKPRLMQSSSIRDPPGATCACACEQRAQSDRCRP